MTFVKGKKQRKSLDAALEEARLAAELSADIQQSLAKGSVLLHLPYTANRKQLEAHLDPACGMNHPLLYGGAMGGGKGQPYNGTVITPFGPTDMASLTVGSQVCCPDGSVARVLQVHELGVVPLYRCHFSDGTSLDVTEQHLWYGWEAMKTYKGERRALLGGGRLSDPIHGKLYTTQQLRTILPKQRAKRAGTGRSFLIPVTQPVPFTRTDKWRERRLDPYVLGVLLGDGALSHAGSISFSCGDAEIAARVAQRLGVPLQPHNAKGACKVYYLPRSGAAGKEIARLGLATALAQNKFIPSEYRYLGVDQRWELLRGLMDTDGTVTSDKLYFTTVSPRLAADVRWLIESLGGVATQTEKTPTYTYQGELRKGQLAYTLYIKFPNPRLAFSLARKQARCKAPQGVYRRMVSIEELPAGPARCITLDHPAGLYLADHCIVTHNSAFLCAEAIRECREIPGNKGLMARRELKTFRATTLVTLLQFMPPPPEAVHRPSAQVFYFANGSQLHYSGLGNEDDKRKLQSMEIGFFFGDEITELEEDSWRMAGTRLRWAATPDDRYKMRGTCNPEPGWVKDHWITNPKTGWVFVPALPLDNLANLPHNYISDMREALPEEWFRAYMLGDWDAFIPTSTVLSPMLLANAVAHTGTPGPEDEAIWGVDVSRFGDDDTVLARRRGTVFDVLDHWGQQSVDETADAILTHYHLARHKPRAINVDDVGVGGGVTDLLKRARREGLLGTTMVNAVIAQQGAQLDTVAVYDAVHYANIKSQLWFKMRLFLEQNDGFVDLPGSPSELKAGLEAHRYEVKGGKATVEPKQLVKQRLGYSPDYADAVILTMFEGRADYVAYQRPAEQLARMTPAQQLAVASPAAAAAQERAAAVARMHAERQKQAAAPFAHWYRQRAMDPLEQDW